MRKISVIIISAALLLLVSCTPSAKYLRSKKISVSQNNNYVRVLIGIEKSTVKIASRSGLRIISKKSNRIVYETRKGKLIFDPEKIKEPYIVETGGTPVFFNSRPYRGKIELHNILGKLYVVNILNIEEYLLSVVPSEMPSGWNKEALKAQAVAARTYTYYHLETKKKSKAVYDLDATTNFQVYKGMSREKKSSTEAVQKTSGIIMTYKYHPILALFHSTSGGRTIDDKYVWEGNDLPYLEGVVCTYSKDSPHYSWNTTLTSAEIKAALARKYRRIGKIRKISFKKIKGRVAEVNVIHQYGKIKMTGNHFRLMFPNGKLRSTFFATRKKGEGLYVEGHGWGHGVGMCQWGARGRAEKGFTYKQILKHYYKGINFKHIKNNYLAQKRTSRHLVN